VLNIHSRRMPDTILGTKIPDDFIESQYANAGAYA